MSWSAECNHGLHSACEHRDCDCRCHDEFEDYDDGVDADEDDDSYYECGMDSSGGCSLAGSEECDFECPYRDTMIANLKKKATK